MGAGNGLLPVRHQAITWTNADLLSIKSWEQISVKFEYAFEIAGCQNGGRFCPGMS